MADPAINHPLTPKRRWFLKTAVALGALGSALGGLVYWNRGMSDGRLTDAALDGAFADSAHFSRMFRSTFGMTPSSVLRPLREVTVLG